MHDDRFTHKSTSYVARATDETTVTVLFLLFQEAVKQSAGLTVNPGCGVPSAISIWFKRGIHHRPEEKNDEIDEPWQQPQPGHDRSAIIISDHMNDGRRVITPRVASCQTNF